MKITRISQLTGNISTLDLDVTIEQMFRFEMRLVNGEYIQDIFSNINAAEREFILTGITPEEWSNQFDS